MAEYVVIGGVKVNSCHLNVKRIFKFQEGNVWILSTKGGTRIVGFYSEAELDAWWLTFQQSSPRIQRQLVLQEPKPRHGLKPGQARRKNRPPKNNVPRSRTFTNQLLDPLKPWSDKYNMPEFDAD
jgi:hypothetical protein